MTHQERGILIWGSVFAILFAITSYLISSLFTDNQQHWFTPVGILIAWALYTTWNKVAKVTMFFTFYAKVAKVMMFFTFYAKVAKVMMFFTFYTLALLIVYIFTQWLLVPMFDLEWINGFDWIRSSLIVIYYVTIVGTLTSSVLSCWSADHLKEDEIGQISINGKMYEFGKNQVNGSLGLFTGLPKSLVNVTAYSAKTTTKTSTSTIQVPVSGSTTNDHFQADFEWNFGWEINDTLRWTLNDGNEANLINAFETEINRWVKDPDNQYKNIKELKVDQENIKDHIRDTITLFVDERYGVKIKNFNLERIELPKKLIEQQNDNAAALAKQISIEEQEAVEIRGAVKHAGVLLKAMKKIDSDTTMTAEKALDKTLILRDKIRATSATIRGGRRGVGIFDADGNPGA